jgi:RNA polymerase sigma factor (sigma-70 family)
MNAALSALQSDRECLDAFVRARDSVRLRPVIQRYLPFVFSSALRRTGAEADATEITHAVFLVLARRARKLRKNAILADWLFDITSLTCRKRQRRWRRFKRMQRNEHPENATVWERLAQHIDRDVDRLPARQRRAVLFCGFLNHDFDSAAKLLRSRRRRVERRARRGLRKLEARTRKRGIDPGCNSLAELCRTNGCAAVFPPELVADICAAIDSARGKRPQLKLARRTLNALAWRRWRRRLGIGIPAALVFIVALAVTAWRIDERSGHSRLLATFLVWSVKHEAKTVPGLAQTARPWPEDATTRQLRAATVRTARDIYQTTNIWLAHLKFTREEWAALQPKKIGVLPNFLQPDGTALLRNPNAQRSGLAGVLGFDFNWTHADLELGGALFTNVAARIKGNGTYLGSLYGEKRAFKVDLKRFVKGQKLGGADELTFNNLVVDQSFISDALAYEFFREAGVPAPRTAYAWITVSVEGKWESRPLGLYLMVEPVNAAFAADRIARNVPVFKPVTYRLFENLGDEWAAYAAIYDLKTRATKAEQQRVIDFARLVTFADSPEFAARLDEFLDLDEFARFMAGGVLLSAYDGILSTGQNFYVYLDPRSNQFGFVPWDLDIAWGGFFLLGTPGQQERASIWHPWVGENRFLERVFAVERFRTLYRAHLEDFLARLFVPERLKRRVDELAAVVGSAVAAESDFRFDKFEQAVGRKPLKPAHNDRQGADRPAHRIKRFIDKRAASVREQLDGKSNGVIMNRNAQK